MSLHHLTPFVGSLTELIQSLSCKFLWNVVQPIQYLQYLTKSHGVVKSSLKECEIFSQSHWSLKCQHKNQPIKKFQYLFSESCLTTSPSLPYDWNLLCNYSQSHRQQAISLKKLSTTAPYLDKTIYTLSTRIQSTINPSTHLDMKREKFSSYWNEMLISTRCS